MAGRVLNLVDHMNADVLSGLKCNLEAALNGLSRTES